MRTKETKVRTQQTTDLRRVGNQTGEELDHFPANKEAKEQAGVTVLYYRTVLYGVAQHCATSCCSCSIFHRINVPE